MPSSILPAERPTKSNEPLSHRLAGFVSVEQDGMAVHRRYLPDLQRAGIVSMDSILQTTQGEFLRKLADRENWRLHLIDGAHRPYRAYLKRHNIRHWRHWLPGKMGIRAASFAGSVEARNAVQLQKLGIPSLPVMAYGDRHVRRGLVESFVLTAELVGYAPLDDFLRDRFNPMSSRAAGNRGDLVRLIRVVASVAARFHGADFNHRDFYCCHFFIRESAQGDFQVNLIDLQRVEQRRWFRRRWIIKDLAQLAFSAPREIISHSRRMLFFKQYLGVRKLQPRDKRLARQILARQRAMQRRLGAHP